MKNKTDINFKKALVTGGAGFIGSHIVDALVDGGCEVTVIDNLTTGNLSNLDHVKDNIKFCAGDIRDQELMIKKAKNQDVIFHQAAVVSVPQTVDDPVLSAMVNELGTIHVLEAARLNSVKRVILASSSAVYGSNPELPKKEEMNSVPLTPFAAQKLGNEMNAKLYYDLYGLETVCLRYFNVYGPRENPSSLHSGVISIFMTKAKKEGTPLIFGDGNQYRDFIFVKDVARVNILAAMSEPACGKNINIASGEHVTINDLWKEIAEIAASDIKPEYRPPRPGDIVESAADITLGRDILGFEPEYSLKKGLEFTFDWYNQI